MKHFHLKIVSLDGLFFDGEAYQVSLRTLDGDISVRAGHMPYVTAIGAGECRVYVEDGEKPHRAACVGGFFSVSKEMVLLAATTFEWAETINVDRANKAKEKAEHILSSSSANDHDKEISKIKLTRANTRLKVIENSKKS